MGRKKRVKHIFFRGLISKDSRNQQEVGSSDTKNDKSVKKTTPSDSNSPSGRSVEPVPPLLSYSRILPPIAHLDESSKSEKDQTEGEWYRDEEGELCFGVPKPKKMRKHTASDGGKVSGKEIIFEQPEENRVTSYKCSYTPRPVVKNHKPRNSSNTCSETGKQEGTSTQPLPDPGNRQFKTYQCAICEKYFPQDQIRSHVLSHPRTTVCPVCGKLMMKYDYEFHMESHNNWCPLCQDKTDKKLTAHLYHFHEVQLLVKINRLFLPGWESKLLFYCLQCKTKFTLAEYQHHQQPHRLVNPLSINTTKPVICKTEYRQPKPAPQAHEPVPPKPKYEPTISKISRMSGTARIPSPLVKPPLSTNSPGSGRKKCTICGNYILIEQFDFHLKFDHPTCPHCHQRLTRQGMAQHIWEAHYKDHQ